MSDRPAVISHDAFARLSIVRRVVVALSNTHRPCTCAECGQPRYRAAKLTHSLFQYGTALDDRTAIDWHRGAFCSKSCHDTYHGV